MDEVPPPSYTTVTGGTPVVTCRVCQVKSSVKDRVYLNKDKGSNETKNTHFCQNIFYCFFVNDVFYVNVFWNNIVFQCFEIL